MSDQIPEADVASKADALIDRVLNEEIRNLVNAHREELLRKVTARLDKMGIKLRESPEVSQ